MRGFLAVQSVPIAIYEGLAPATSPALLGARWGGGWGGWCPCGASPCPWSRSPGLRPALPVRGGGGGSSPEPRSLSAPCGLGYPLGPWAAPPFPLLPCPPIFGGGGWGCWGWGGGGHCGLHPPLPARPLPADPATGEDLIRAPAHALSVGVVAVVLPDGPSSPSGRSRGPQAPPLVPGLVPLIWRRPAEPFARRLLRPRRRSVCRRRAARRQPALHRPCRRSSLPRRQPSDPRARHGPSPLHWETRRLYPRRGVPGVPPLAAPGHPAVPRPAPLECRGPVLRAYSSSGEPASRILSWCRPCSRRRRARQGARHRSRLWPRLRWPRWWGGGTRSS